MNKRKLSAVLVLVAVCTVSFFGWMRAQEAGPSPHRADPSTRPVDPAAAKIHDDVGFLPDAKNSVRETVIAVPFPQVFEAFNKARPEVTRKHRELLEQRYDLSDKPTTLMMSGGRKPVQGGVRVKLPQGVTWEQLADMKPGDIRDRGVLPAGLLPLPHPLMIHGGQVFPKEQIDAIRKAETRSLDRFDVEFDLPAHLTPEFPPPVFLTTRPDIGDFSRGQLITRANFYDLANGILTPVQIEGLRLLLTPFPQEEFNQTEDRASAEPSLGVACLDCHANFHTNAAFHLNPDNRPQVARLRLDTVSLRGMFNQQIHGSKRSLRSVEDFTEFEQQTAYFNGDHVSAVRKGANHPLRETAQVTMMAQMQNIIDFPPAPKLTVLNRLDPDKATPQELAGEKLFWGKAQCSQCHLGPAFLDDKMHDLHMERFYKPRTIHGMYIHADGPMKTMALRGIKDSPPYFHDGRCLTLEDTVELFNLVLGLKLSQEEKAALTAFMRQL